MAKPSSINSKMSNYGDNESRRIRYYVLEDEKFIRLSFLDSAMYSTINIATNRQRAVKACSLVGHRPGA